MKDVIERILLFEIGRNYEERNRNAFSSQVSPLRSQRLRRTAEQGISSNHFEDIVLTSVGRVRYFILILFLIFTVVGCEEKHATVKAHIILRTTESYEVWWIEACGDHQKIEISQQAMHYDSSYVFRDSTTNDCDFYWYSPQQGYVGDDYVEMKVYDYNSYYFYILDITVTN